ncbi:MAG TPA: trigger factor [Rhizomicrobium sp.]|nr:trigger factor [Rhizomicrobium sp.]
MQITQTVSEGLRREFRIVVAAKDLDEKLVGRLDEMKPRVHLKGFRPGKAPISFLKKAYGKSLMQDIVNEAATQGKDKAIADNSLKPAFPPRVELASELEDVVEGKADLEFTVTVDLMPDFELADPAKLQIEKLVADVTDEEVEGAIDRLAEQARSYTARVEGEAAQDGDAIVMDFVGSIDGEEFPGGRAENFNLVLGSGQLIPGFEDQLIGAKHGESREVKVKFPDNYQEPKLAGKDAVFAVKVNEVKSPDPIAIDDELAKRVGLNSLGELKERMREQMKTDFARASRLHTKRRILDALDAAHSFPLPSTMVEGEFGAIWRAVEAELQREGKTAEDEGKTEEELKKEYHDIAERRVRLGLVLARIGEQNGIQVNPDEIQRAVAMRARQFPGQEQQVFDYYASSPQAMAEIRAPIFEDKVVDFIAELCEITERKVDRETLFLDPDEAAAKLGEK